MDDASLGSLMHLVRTLEIVQKIEIRQYNNLIISIIIKNVERASTARARESRDFHVRRTE